MFSRDKMFVTGLMYRFYNDLACKLGKGVLQNKKIKIESESAFVCLSFKQQKILVVFIKPMKCKRVHSDSRVKKRLTL